MAQTTTAPTRLHSGNPALSEKFVETHLARSATRSMTVAGVSVKTLILLVVLVAGGAWGWASATTPVGVDLGSGYANTTVTIPGGFWLASFGAFLLGIFIAVQPRRAALLGVLYALCEGFCLGAISAMFDAQTDGIVGAAVLSTVCVFVVALLLYVTRIVKPTQKLAFAVDRRHGRTRVALLLRVHPVDLRLGLALQRQLPHRRHRRHALRDRARRAQPRARLRHHRGRRRAGAPKELEWYLALRADGHARLAVHLDPQAARPAVPQPLTARSCARPESNLMTTLRSSGRRVERVVDVVGPHRAGGELFEP